MLSQASLIVNIEGETVLRVRAMIKNDRFEYIISKLIEICTDEESQAVCCMTDTHFSVPNGELVLRQSNQCNQGLLIFYKRHIQSALLSPGSIDFLNYILFELDLTYAITSVLTLSLNIEKQLNRTFYSFMLSNYIHIIIEPCPINTDYNNIYIQVSLENEQYENMSCIEATIIINNLMNELSITDEDLVF